MQFDGVAVRIAYRPDKRVTARGNGVLDAATESNRRIDDAGDIRDFDAELVHREVEEIRRIANWDQFDQNVAEFAEAGIERAGADAAKGDAEGLGVERFQPLHVVHPERDRNDGCRRRGCLRLRRRNICFLAARQERAHQCSRGPPGWDRLPQHD